MVAFPCESVPLELMVRSPATVKFLLRDNVAAWGPPSVNDLQAEEPEILGWKLPVKLASPTMASVVDAGTPAVQLLALLQEVLEVPFQLVCAVAV